MLLKNILTTTINNNKINLSGKQFDKLLAYANILKLSQRKSFASWDNDNQGINIHFNDSFHTLPFVNFNDTFLDIGSGAGIPGIIFSIIWGESKAILLESQKKRFDFLLEAINALHINKRVKCILGRAEVYARQKQYRESFQLVTARALAPFPKFLEYTSGFVKPEGYLHAIRGIKDKQHFNQYHRILNILKLELNQERNYYINDNNVERWSALFKKTGNIAPKYPRQNQAIGIF